MPELSVLAGRLAARGHQLVEWTGGDLQAALPEASSLVVAAPMQLYDDDEIEAVETFVSRGGRLLMIGDPTRFQYLVDDWGWVTGVDSDARYLNSLGARFGIAFVDDYLYNVGDNEGSFRNLRISKWGESDLAQGLETVVFFAAHSLSVGDSLALAWADDNTWSSATDRAGGLVVAAQSADGLVVALGDLTFMAEPYHTVRDNGRFIAQLADFLTGAERRYDLADFPLLFGDKTAFVFTNRPEIGPGHLQLVDDLQEAFDASDRTLVLVDQPDTRTDTIYAGIYSQAGPVTDTLAEHGVTLVFTPTQALEDAETAAPVGDDEPTEAPTGDQDRSEQQAEGRVLVDGLGSYDMSGIGLLALESDGEQVVLVVLAASQEGLANLLGRLPDRDLGDCVLAESLILCPSGVPDEAVQERWEQLEVAPEDEEPDDGEPPEEVRGELAYGEWIEDELEPDEAHRWSFEGQAGEVVTIRAEPDSETDLVLELLDADGDPLASADDEVTGYQEIIEEYELTETATYLIQVRDYWDEGGSYTLLIELVTETGEGGGGGEGGEISLGETVEGELVGTDIAIWAFEGEADQAVTIIAVSTDDGDLVLELRDAEGYTLATSDDGLSGEEERLEGRLPADGNYQIAVYDFYGDDTSYTLSLLEGGEGDVFGGWGILIVSADDGVPLTEGRTGADIYYQVLSPNYDVTLWSLSQDGPLGMEDMQGHQLVIWSSGDFVDGDSEAVLNVILEGGSLLLSGASSGLATAEDLAPLRDIQVSETTSVLTTGFTPGEVIELTGEIDALVFDGSEEEEGQITLFLRGPTSDQAGDVIAIATDAGEFLDLQILIMGFPLYMLPEDYQVQIINNAMIWFGVTPSS